MARWTDSLMPGDPTPETLTNLPNQARRAMRQAHADEVEAARYWVQQTQLWALSSLGLGVLIGFALAMWGAR